MNPRVLVIGGTGLLGLPVARRLREDGFEVTILTTDPDRARAGPANEFPLAYGDVTEAESLQAPLEGQDFVYLNLNGKLDPRLYQEIEINGTANTARVARESGVKRIGMISGSASKGEEEGIAFLDGKVKAERALIESGVPYTVMRPSWFFEALPQFIQHGRAAIIGKQPIPRAWLAAGDYACQVSRGFQTDEAANQCFYNLGPQRLTAMEALELFCRRFHPKLKPTAVPYAMARMAAMMPGLSLLRKAIPFFKYFETRAEDMSPDEADRVLGPNLTTLEEWLESYQMADEPGD